MAIGKPPSLGIDETVAKIHGKLAEVNSEAMIQLHKRSQKIHIVVEDNNVHIKKLETSNMELERLNGVLTRSLERLEVQHEKFVQEVKRMWLPQIGFWCSLAREANIRYSSGTSEK